MGSSASKAHTRKIFNLCYRFTGRPTEAEDLTQEVFIKIFQTLQSFDAAQGSFGLGSTGWRAIIWWTIIGARGKIAVTSSLDDEVSRDAGNAQPGRRAREPEVESRERRELLQQGLEKLSPDLREAVILRDLNDLDYDEIAQVLSVPQGTVKSRINRGRLELARVLKRMEGMKGPAKAGGAI